MQDLYKFKQKLDRVSPSFCIAKWKQVTVHLESGLTHSCHHPRAHVIPLNELEKNVSALHNTNYKKSIRKKMLAGEIVNECEYCNRIEQYTDDVTFSDRIYKSSFRWARDYMTEIVNNPYDYDVFPSYFEVSFSSICNCSCIYCSATFSSSWVKEIKKFGKYLTSTATRGLDESPAPKYAGKTNNLYYKAFWKWWPDLYKNLEFFRITGGEPLLNNDTFKVLDYIIENPKPDLTLEINSNLCIHPKIFDRFIEKYKQIAKNHKYVSTYTSCEAEGEKAEYIRPGLKYNEWLSNCRTYLSEVETSTIIFMCTYNILSISSFKDFLKDILKLKMEFQSRVTIDIPILMNPAYLQPIIITKDFMKYIRKSIEFMNNNMPMFDDLEISKLTRIYHMVEEKPLNIETIISRKDFGIFIDEHDRRYKSKFLEVFPEYTDFYFHCKEL